MAVALRELDRDRQSRPALRVVPPAPTPPTPPAVFWRRRLLVLLLVVAVAAGAVTAARAALASPPAPAGPALEVAVVVAPGDTLWDFAGRYAPADVDRAGWVARVADRNGVDAGALRPGTSLLVPVSGASVTAAPSGAGSR